MDSQAQGRRWISAWICEDASASSVSLSGASPLCQCCSQTWHLLAQVGVLGLLVIYAQACELYTGRQFDLLSKYPYS